MDLEVHIRSRGKSSAWVSKTNWPKAERFLSKCNIDHIFGHLRQT